MPPDRTTTAFDLPSQSIKTESGRIVILPVQPSFQSPMLEFCLLLPISPCKMLLHVQAERHPAKVKKHRVNNIKVHMNHLDKPKAKVVATSSLLLIGDATFVYVDRRKSDEYDRAVHACKREGSMCGSYRTGDGQVAASVRLGDKECSLHVSARDSVIEIVPRWESADY